MTVGQMELAFRMQEQEGGRFLVAVARGNGPDEGNAEGCFQEHSPSPWLTRGG